MVPPTYLFTIAILISFQQDSKQQYKQMASSSVQVTKPCVLCIVSQREHPEQHLCHPHGDLTPTSHVHRL